MCITEKPLSQEGEGPMTPRTVKKRLTVEKSKAFQAHYDPPVTRAHIDCYRTNYSLPEWEKVLGEGASFGMIPVGALVAIEVLCQEIERLNGWRK